MEASLYTPNAILFIFDVTNRTIEVPKYMDTILTAANESCVSVGTQADVDGEVIVKLQDQLSVSDKRTCQQVFRGFIETPGSKIAVVSAEFVKILEKGVKSQRSEVSIWTDDPNYPGIVLIEAE